MKSPFTPGAAREIDDPAAEADHIAKGRTAARLTHLAKAQRDNAEQILDEVREASESGMTWREIGEALGMEYTTLFRQFQAGSPVVVVHPFHAKPGH